MDNGRKALVFLYILIHIFAINMIYSFSFDLPAFFLNTFFGFNWKGKLKILGVYFCNYKRASHIDENWSERIVKIKRLISILGKNKFKRCWKIMYY